VRGRRDRVVAAGQGWNSALLRRPGRYLWRRRRAWRSDRRSPRTWIESMCRLALGSRFYPLVVAVWESACSPPPGERG
jgi:hypothetical protein